MPRLNVNLFDDPEPANDKPGRPVDTDHPFWLVRVAEAYPSPTTRKDARLYLLAIVALGEARLKRHSQARRRARP